MNGDGSTGPEGLIPKGERVILSLKPDPAYIVLAPLWPLAGIGALAVLAAWAAGRWPESIGPWMTPLRSWVYGACAALALITWRALDRAARRYILTDRRIISARGIFRRSVVDAPLESIQHVTVTRLVRERLTGLGTLGFATAGTAWVETHWLMVARPADRLAEVRRALEAAGTRGGRP
jgi:hypothetical protein